MTANLRYVFLFTGIIAGLVFLAIAAFGILYLVFDELVEGEEGLSLGRISLPFISRIGQGHYGNEFTGQASGLMFGAASLPVALGLAARLLTRRLPFSPGLKEAVSRLNGLQKKYLMPFHTYFSLLALALGILHLSWSSCPGNPFPEWGLILMAVLTGSGLALKLKIAPKFLRKRLYQFHASLWVTGALGAILLAGHVLMD